MKYFFFIFLIFLLLCFFNYIYVSRNQLLYRFNAVINKTTQSGIPTSSKMSKELLSFISDKLFISFTFIDFGSGSGDVINLVYPYFSKTIGVELDMHSSKVAQKRFVKQKSVSILNMNMIDYTFENSSTFLYMYEPLFLLDPILARKIYFSVFKNLTKQVTSIIYVVYVDSVNPILGTQFFINHGFELVDKKKISKGFPFVYNTFYIFKRK